MDERKQISDSIISTLVRLHNEAKEPNITTQEWARRGNAITYILNKIEADFGVKYMLHIFVWTSKQLGESLAPINHTIVQKLLSNGCKIKKWNKILRYSTKTSI
jgi:hypothetical protein